MVYKWMLLITYWDDPPTTMPPLGFLCQRFGLRYGPTALARVTALLQLVGIERATVHTKVMGSFFGGIQIIEIKTNIFISHRLVEWKPAHLGRNQFPLQRLELLELLELLEDE